MDKNDDSIANNIIELLNMSKSIEDILNKVKEEYCLRCGQKQPQNECWCDYDSPIENSFSSGG